MKTKLLLFVAVIACLYSCTNNDQGPISVSESEIVGTWNVIDYNFEGAGSYTVSGNTLSFTVRSTGKDYDFTFDFSSNPNILSATGTYTSVSEVTFLGQTTSDEFPVSSVDGFDSGTWSVNGNQFTLTANGMTSTSTITEFTGNLMTITSSIEQNQNVQGIDVTVTGTVSLTLQK